jgi:DNA-binding NarL/FixJ family response regulator
MPAKRIVARRATAFGLQHEISHRKLSHCPMNAIPQVETSLETSPPRRIAVVDDMSIIRAVFRSIAEDSPNLNLLWTAPNITEARESLKGELPDLLILDVNLPDGDGFDFAIELTQDYPRLPVLMFSAHEGGSFVEKAAQCGAKGFLGKNVSPQKVVEAITIICSGGTFLGAY